jgi:molybdenum cofactor cytidylyltransferase
MTIVPVILAAGNSQRAGSPKALLRIRDQTFVRHILDEFHAAGLLDVIVVLGAAAEDVAKELANTGATMVVNHYYQDGQLSSVIEGVKAAEQLRADAILLHPVDHPLIRREIVAILAARFRETNAPLILPVFQGRRGHPVLFSAKLFAELKSAPPEIGARSVVWAHALEIIEVETEDEGVVANINTPQDYENLRSRLHRPA